MSTFNPAIEARSFNHPCWCRAEILEIIRCDLLVTVQALNTCDGVPFWLEWVWVRVWVWVWVWVWVFIGTDCRSAVDRDPHDENDEKDDRSESGLIHFFLTSFSLFNSAEALCVFKLDRLRRSCVGVQKKPEDRVTTTIGVKAEVSLYATYRSLRRQWITRGRLGIKLQSLLWYLYWKRCAHDRHVSVDLRTSRVTAPGNM